MLSKITLKETPELIALIPAAERTAEAYRGLLSLPPEKILLRWLNYQVRV